MCTPEGESSSTEHGDEKQGEDEIADALDAAESDGEPIESVTALAERLDRNKGDVSRDLRRLSQLQVVTFEQDGPAKRPRLKHQSIVVTPIAVDSTVLLDGEPTDEHSPST